jgi:hypothetical protein
VSSYTRRVAVDEGLLNRARLAETRWAEAQRHAEQAKADYWQAIRRLHLAGASFREIAEALGLSHQRVHQIIEATGGTAGWKSRKKATDPACSFCGASKDVVARLIAGPGVFICDACVALAHRVLHRTRPDSTSRTHIDPLPAGSTLPCSFCDKPAGPVKALAAGPGVRICHDCVQFCTEVLAAHPE